MLFANRTRILKKFRAQSSTKRAACTSHGGKASVQPLLFRIPLLYQQNLPSGLSRIGDTSGKLPKSSPVQLYRHAFRRGLSCLVALKRSALLSRLGASPGFVNSRRH